MLRTRLRSTRPPCGQPAASEPCSATQVGLGLSQVRRALGSALAPWLCCTPPLLLPPRLWAGKNLLAEEAGLESSRGDCASCAQCLCAAGHVYDWPARPRSSLSGSCHDSSDCHRSASHPPCPAARSTVMGRQTTSPELQLAGLDATPSALGAGRRERDGGRAAHSTLEPGRASPFATATCGSLGPFRRYASRTLCLRRQTPDNPG